MKADLLHVITAISNPLRLKSRIKLYREFEARYLISRDEDRNSLL